MKAAKLLAVLALAGFCGTAESQARSHRFEIRQLEKDRAERMEEHREAKERLRELSSRSVLRGGGEEKVRLRPAVFEAGEVEVEYSETFNSGLGSLDGSWADSREVEDFSWEMNNPRLVAERELEEARMREAARELERIDRAIRKERARERGGEFEI